MTPKSPARDTSLKTRYVASRMMATAPAATIPALVRWHCTHELPQGIHPSSHSPHSTFAASARRGKVHCGSNSADTASVTLLPKLCWKPDPTHRDTGHATVLYTNDGTDTAGGVAVFT